jgi:hypothetical protein
MVAFKCPIMQGHQPNCISVVGLTATLEGLEHSNPGSQHCSYSGNLVRVNFEGWTNGVLSPFTLHVFMIISYMPDNERGHNQRDGHFTSRKYVIGF